MNFLQKIKNKNFQNNFWKFSKNFCSNENSVKDTELKVIKSKNKRNSNTKNNDNNIEEEVKEEEYPNIKNFYKIKSKKMDPPNIKILIDDKKFFHNNVLLSNFDYDLFHNDIFKNRNPVPVSPTLQHFEVLYYKINKLDFRSTSRNKNISLVLLWYE